MQRAEALQLYNLPFHELISRADRVRHEMVGDVMEMCSIINARSGRCSEDCKFCAQSAHYRTGIENYPLITAESLLEGARRAHAVGSRYFGIVTSGEALTDDEVAQMADAVRVINAEVDINICASLGGLRREQLALLHDAGVVRYHHNIETSRRYYAEIVSTHTFDHRQQTIHAAAEVGMSVCSGGIIGMGETREDRIDMALTLRELPVQSVPINVLLPIPGTPLAHMAPLSPVEVVKTVAIFRLLMPEKTIKLAAGRESVLKDFQGMAFFAGANSMMIGGYLTRHGRADEEDQRLIEEIHTAWRN